MKSKKNVSVIIIMGLLMFPIQVLSQNEKSPTLRELISNLNIDIGAAVGARQIQMDTNYQDILAKEFSMLTTENAMKFSRIHPNRDRYTFQNADLIVDFAVKHDMKIRGHTLVWHRQVPGWIENGEWTPESIKKVLHDHIKTVVERYKDTVKIWDVVNEAFENDGEYRETIWYKTIGPDYIDLAFQWAHEANPDALLFYNDYGAEGLNSKSERIYRMVKRMKEQGIPIHGVGLQFHIPLSGMPGPDDLLSNIERIGELGVEVHITELDVRLKTPVDERRLVAQAQTYQRLLETCLETSHCTAFVLWGFTDKYSWIPSFYDGYDKALIFDENYQPKPAYHAIHDLLMQKNNASAIKNNPFNLNDEVSDAKNH